MRFVELAAALAIAPVSAALAPGPGPAMYHDYGQAPLRHVCPNYEAYSRTAHGPYSRGLMRLPFQRPPANCRTFKCEEVEDFISEITAVIADPDVARLFENAFPNTLDTTIKYHQPGPHPLTFVVTGDIDAEWLRDSHHQLSSYVTLAPRSQRLRELILGAIALHSRYVLRYPHCNAFHPPVEANIRGELKNEDDEVHPTVLHSFVFECKYELDSLASFLGLANEYYSATGDTSFMTHYWLSAIARLLDTIEDMTVGSVNETTGTAIKPPYTFQRWTNLGTETTANRGWGNPVRYTGMSRSFFRPSDDACIYQFLIPANAQMSVELGRLSEYLDSGLGRRAGRLSTQLREAIWEHGVIDHPRWGRVFAFEVDGYGSSLLMDDANMPSLLGLPDVGFIDVADPVYQNTRAMVMSSEGNPYYMKGPYFEGIGGPHVGVRAAWPLSRIVAMRTTDDLSEIRQHIRSLVNSTRGLGLIHESVQVDTNEYSRPWFSWANSEFAKSIIRLYNQGRLAEATTELFLD